MAELIGNRQGNVSRDPASIKLIPLNRKRAEALQRCVPRLSGRAALFLMVMQLDEDVLLGEFVRPFRDQPGRRWFGVDEGVAELQMLAGATSNDTLDSASA